MTNFSITCGFIGLGSQGAPIARRIVDAGYRTLLWARRPETLEPFKNTSAEMVVDMPTLAKQADHIGICVIDDAAVEEVCEQLLACMRAGSRLVIHSTTLPATCRNLARRAQARDVLFIEAPVSGGGTAAAAGKLTLMTAGETQAVAAAHPIFETFAQQIFHLGAIGNAQLAKLLNNALLAAHLGLAHSAAECARQLGLDRGAFLQLLSKSSGASYALEVYARQKTPGNFSHTATLLDKIRLLGDELGHSHPAVRALQQAATS